ncbi:RHS repeat-associated core domain-containing protein [Kitasatospora sp. McL0602]|uniref:RHS repeat-associated core domain-containing protein n=1 Tax=Kitasatospora sp. McL0602 TaxID=3439530 RepID=UPI003F899002
MSNQIVKALEHAAEKIGGTLAKDAGKAVKDFYHSAGKNLKKVAANVRETEEKHAKDLGKLFEGGKHDAPHPHTPGGGGPGHHGGSHPKGRGRDQVKSPRTEAREHDSRKCPGEPVDIATGRMFIDQTDASLPGSLPLLFTRNFESGLLTGRWMGPKWLCTFDERLELDEQGIVHIRADRITQAYPHPEPGDPVHATAGSRHELGLEEGHFTITDPATGQVKTFTPTPDGDEALLTEVRDRHGRHYTLAYDADGAPHSITHSGGYRLLVTVEHDRITALRLANATDTGGDALLMRYGYTDGHLTTVYNSSGKPMRFANDTSGRILSWTDRNNSQYHYTYDAFDRITDEGGADGALRFHFTYGDPDPTTGLKPHTETNALGHTTTYTVNDHAQITTVTDPLGNTTHYERDDHDRLLAETDPLGRTTRYQYDGAGDLVAVTHADGTRSTAAYASALNLPSLVVEPGGATWRQEYDGAGRRVAVTDPLGGTTRYAHDELGHLTAITNPVGDTTRIRSNAAGLPLEITDPTGASARYEYDPFGRLVTFTDAVGGVTRTAWTVEGHLASRTAADGVTEVWTYDGEGNPLSYTGRLGIPSTFEFTHFETLAARTGPDGARMEFRYDANMQLVAVVDPLGREWTFTYDPAGRLASETDFDGRVVSYELDVVGQVVSRTDVLGQVIRYRHDLMGRVTEIDAAGRASRFTYDDAGHLVRASAPDAELHRTVDAQGRLLAETVNGRTTTHARDQLGRRTERTTPGGHSSSWAYNALGLPTALVTRSGAISLGYDAAGRESDRTLAGRLTLTRDWDDLHRLTGQTLRTPDELLQQRAYRYHSDGNLAGLDDLLAGSRAYDLDPAGRVTAVRASSGAESYAYDPAGNLTDADWPATSATAAAHGPRTYTGTRLIGAGRVRYEYDAAGRTTLRQVTRISRKPDTWRYSWDAENRLTQVTTPDGTQWRYLYDPVGRRIAKQRLTSDQGVAEQTDFTWDGASLAEQTTYAPYLPGPHTISWDHVGLHPLAQSEQLTITTVQEPVRTERRFFAVLTDLVGTPTELIDPTDDTIAWRAIPTLWGNTTWPNDSSAYTPLRFPGQYFDPETRLNYNLHRYYDAETARYLSPDPLGLGGSDNPVGYVGNPHTWTDPTGLSPHEDRTTKLAGRAVANARAGKRPLTNGYHGRLPAAKETEIMANPDAVYASTGGGGRWTFRQGPNIVVTEGAGPSPGKLVTSYGPAGPRGESGASIFGGKPSEPGMPMTHDMIVNGEIPVPGGGFLPPAVQLFPSILNEE